MTQQTKLEQKQCLECMETYTKKTKQTSKQWSDSKYCSFDCRVKNKHSTSYRAIHMWLNDHYEKIGVCTLCNSIKNTEWALIKGHEYTKEIGDYMELCVKCHRNYDMTDEIRAKMSKSQTGTKKPWKQKAVVCHKEGEILKFSSISDASNLLEIHHVNISKALKGNIKTAGGYKWKYANT